MDHQNFWTNMAAQWHVMETNNVRNPTAALSESPDDPTQMVTPGPRQSDIMLDGQKTGAILLFSGVILALVGVIFTAVGWQYLSNPTFEWDQLLGPILISVGGTFMFTSVCKFGIISCWPCRRWDEETVAMPEMEQTSTGQSFTICSINQPITLHNTATMLCIPSVYDFRSQEVHQATEFQPGGSMSGVHAAAPPYDAVYCVNNAGFTEEEDGSPYSTETDRRGRRIEKTEDERGHGDDSNSTCSHPPAYEDIYPSLDKHNPT